MAELFGTSVPNINQHITCIYDDEELRPEATIKKYLTVQTKGSRQVKRLVDHYNLEMIIAVGFRVRSRRRRSIHMADWKVFLEKFLSDVELPALDGAVTTWP